MVCGECTHSGPPKAPDPDIGSAARTWVAHRHPTRETVRGMETPSPLQSNPWHPVVDVWQGIACIMLEIQQIGVAARGGDVFGPGGESRPCRFLVEVLLRASGTPRVVVGNCVLADRDAIRRPGTSAGCLLASGRSPMGDVRWGRRIADPSNDSGKPAEASEEGGAEVAISPRSSRSVKARFPFQISPGSRRARTHGADC